MGYQVKVWSRECIMYRQTTFALGVLLVTLSLQE
jgi:hypothetical protein